MMSGDLIDVRIPMPVQVVIDDVGWWSGCDGHETGEPFRTGIARNHVPADYRAIAELGRRLNMRPQAAMILCEWDRDNFLRRVPTATWQGAHWDNRRWVGPWMQEAAQLLREQRGHVEVALHGLGHEYWHAPGQFTRAEWHDSEGNMRPREHVAAHLEAYAHLLDQHDLGPFPESFVPCAFRHYFGRGEQGLIPLLQHAGVKYMSTPFSVMHSSRPPQHERLGVELGMMNVNRDSGAFRVPWRELDYRPQEEIAGPICGLHWPNILHADPERNLESVERWVRFLQPYDHRLGRMLARDTAECWTQLAYHALVAVKVEPGQACFDFSKLDALGARHLRDVFTIKMPVPDVEMNLQAEALRVISHRHDAVGGHRVVVLRREGKGAHACLRWSHSQIA